MVRGMERIVRGSWGLFRRTGGGAYGSRGARDCTTSPETECAGDEGLETCGSGMVRGCGRRGRPVLGVREEEGTGPVNNVTGTPGGERTFDASEESWGPRVT